MRASSAPVTLPWSVIGEANMLLKMMAGLLRELEQTLSFEFGYTPDKRRPRRRLA